MNTQPIMHVQNEAIQRAIKLLTAAGCQFAILTANGTKHNTLPLAPPERKRTPSRFKRGSIKAYYDPILEEIAPGATHLIPFGPFGENKETRETLRSAIVSECSRVWGNGSYISHLTDNGIELLRMD